MTVAEIIDIGIGLLTLVGVAAGLWLSWRKGRIRLCVIGYTDEPTPEPESLAGLQWVKVTNIGKSPVKIVKVAFYYQEKKGSAMVDTAHHYFDPPLEVPPNDYEAVPCDPSIELILEGNKATGVYAKTTSGLVVTGKIEMIAPEDRKELGLLT